YRRDPTQSHRRRPCSRSSVTRRYPIVPRSRCPPLFTRVVNTTRDDHEARRPRRPEATGRDRQDIPVSAWNPRRAMAHLGIMIEGQEGLTWERWRRIADAAEQLGYESLWRSDHL